MFTIKPISLNPLSGATAVNRPTQMKELSQRSTTPVSFGLHAISFTGQGQAAQTKPITPRFDATKPVGQRLNILA